MDQKLSLVVTSISAPNDVLKSLAAGCRDRNIRFYLIGDESSPPDFRLEGCEFYGLERQAQTGLRTAALAPRRHYARKNIGYLLAIQSGANVIVEIDDDNSPRESFWSERRRARHVALVRQAGWVNVYKYFTEGTIWPRGFPLDSVRLAVPDWQSLESTDADCPIQQGLVDENPDVDAIYRLVLPLPVRFQAGRRVALADGVWCPFNSQNTSWWRDAFPLLYLPATCSFRMTDILRGFVAQRIAWANSWSVLFHEATVYQERNPHNLLRDFQDELSGYLQGRAVAGGLEKLKLAAGPDRMPDNLRLCYELLVRLGMLEAREMVLLEAWLADLGPSGVFRQSSGSR